MVLLAYTKVIESCDGNTNSLVQGDLVSGDVPILIMEGTPEDGLLS